MNEPSVIRKLSDFKEIEPNAKNCTNHKKNFNDVSISKRSMNIFQLKNEKDKNLSLKQNESYSKYKDTLNFDVNKYSHNLNNTKNTSNINKKNNIDSLEIKNNIKNSDGKYDILNIKSKNNINYLKSKSYINILKNSVHKYVTNTNKRKSTFEEQKRNELNNNIKKKYMESNNNKTNESNRAENNNSERNINLKNFNSNNQFMELKSATRNSENIKNLKIKSTIKNNNENISRIKQVWPNLKNNDNELKFKSIKKSIIKKNVEQVTSNENIKNMDNSDNTLIDINKTKNETNHENKKIISHISLIKNNRINKNNTEVKQNNTAKGILNNKNNEIVSSVTDNIKKNILNIKVKGINKSSLLHINKNENEINKFSSFLPTYISNKCKSSFPKKKNILSNEKFHQDLKKILINTIINPDREKDISDQILSKNPCELSKKGDISLDKRNLINKENTKSNIKSVLSKNSIYMKEKKPLIKNLNDSNIKQNLIRRFSTFADNKRFPLKKNNLTKSFSITFNEKKDQSNNKNNLIHDTNKFSGSYKKLEHEKNTQLKELEVSNNNNFSCNINNKSNNRPNILHKPLNYIEKNKNLLRNRESAKVAFSTILNKRNILLENLKKENKINKSKDLENKKEVLSHIPKKLSTLPIKKMNISNLNKEYTCMNRKLKTGICKNYNQSEKNYNIKSNNKLNENLKKNGMPSFRNIIKNNSGILNYSLKNEKKDTLKNNIYIQDNNNNKEISKWNYYPKLNENNMDEKYLKNKDKKLEEEIVKNKDKKLEEEIVKNNENTDDSSQKFNLENNCHKTYFYEEIMPKKKQLPDNSIILLKNTLNEVTDNINNLSSLNKEIRKSQNFKSNNSNEKYVLEDISMYTQTKLLSDLLIKEYNDEEEKKYIENKVIFYSNKNECDDNFSNEHFPLIKEENLNFITPLDDDKIIRNYKENNGNNDVKKKGNPQFSNEPFSFNKKIIKTLDDKRVHNISEYNEKEENTFMNSREEKNTLMNISKKFLKLNINNEIVHNDTLKDKINEKVDSTFKKNDESKNKGTNKYIHIVMNEYKNNPSFHKKSNEAVENESMEIPCYESYNSENKNNTNSYINNDEKNIGKKIAIENIEKIKEDIDNDKIKLINNSNGMNGIPRDVEKEKEILINHTNEKNIYEKYMSPLNKGNLNMLMLSDNHREYSNIYNRKEKSYMHDETENIKNKNENYLHNKKKTLEKLNDLNEDVLTIKKEGIINCENWKNFNKEQKNNYLNFTKLNKNNNDVQTVGEDKVLKKSKSPITNNDYKKKKKYEHHIFVEKNGEEKKMNHILNSNLETIQHKEKGLEENIVDKEKRKNKRYAYSNKISKKFLLNKYVNKEKEKNTKYNFYSKLKKNYNLSVYKLSKINLKKRGQNKINNNIFHLKNKEKNIDTNFQVHIDFLKEREEKEKGTNKRKIENFLNITSNNLCNKQKKAKLNYPSERYNTEGDNKIKYLKNQKTSEKKKKKFLKKNNIFHNETGNYHEQKNNNLINMDEHNFEEKKVKINEREKLKNYLEKNKNIFFYEHEWISLIFQVISNNQFYLAEQLMTLIFEKEEQLYKSFVDDEKKFKEKNKSDYNENEKDVNINDINENGIGKNNINTNRNRKNRKLSDFMQQIVEGCPKEWPLLDIGILIIVSQIVCFIFSFNKWNFFCESCRIFEKYCIAILLNSSLINLKKNDNTILMFEHDFFYKIVIPKNYKPSSDIIKYHSNYLKNDYLIKEKTVLDVIFLALAYYITISHNLSEYIKQNNIISYLNLFHKSVDKKKKKEKKNNSYMNEWNCTNSKSIKYRFSENLCVNKLKKYNYKERKRRKTSMEKNLRKRLSILRTTKCINKRINNIKHIHLKKMSTNKEDNHINENSGIIDNLEKESIGNNEKEDKTRKKKISQNSNYINNYVLFKNDKIDTIVKYQTKTNFEKLLCLIIIEIFNLIYDNRKYSVENILIIRKFFRVFLNITQKKFISLSLHLYLKKNENKKYFKDGNEENNRKKVTVNDTKKDLKEEINNEYKKCDKNANREEVKDKDQKLNNLIPPPNFIYDNYSNMWMWIERIFSENFYEINNMLYNLCFSKKSNIENKDININYEKIELISQNIKRFSSLQKHNCTILKNYWIIFGLKERISKKLLSSNSLLSHNYFPNNFFHNENIFKNNIFFKLEKKDLLYDTLTLYFLSWVECIYKAYISIDEIPSFLHLQNKKGIMNEIINKKENNLTLNESLKKSGSITNISMYNECNGNDFYEKNEKENIGLLLKNIKTKLKIYDIHWHEQYEKKYINLLICMKIMKKKLKQKKLFKKIMKYNISSIWLNKSQVYLQYVQITINCKFFLGSSYHEIYLFIKKNYEFVIHMIEHNTNKNVISGEYTGEEKKEIYVEDDNNYIYKNENRIDENFLLMAWEIANFYFCILYFKLELKCILLEILKWIQIFKKEDKLFYGFFKFRCVSYILHILIFTNKYKFAQKVIKQISQDYFKWNSLEVESKIMLRNYDGNNSKNCDGKYSKNYNGDNSKNNNSGNDNYNKNENNNEIENNNIIAHNKRENAKNDLTVNVESNIKKCVHNDIMNNKKERNNTSFSNFEKTELHSHIINKCYLYDKWINFKIKKYNSLIIYLLKKKNIVKLILFNNKNLNILIKKKKEKKLIKKVSVKMEKLQNILLSLYCLCVKLYKSYYYHSSILHYNTSQQILAASKYLNIVTKKKEIIMNYFSSSYEDRKNIKKSNFINISNSFIYSQNLLNTDNIFNDNTNLLKASLCNEENNYFVENNKEYMKYNIAYNINNNENNDLFYLHALILSIQIQYTLSISIIICSDLFNFPRKLKKLKKIKKKNKKIQKENYKNLTFISSLFNYKILCKHYRIINSHDINIGKKEKMKKKKKEKEKKEKYGSGNYLNNNINNFNSDTTQAQKENMNNHSIFNETKNNTNNINGYDLMQSQEYINHKVMKFTDISLNDFISILDEGNNRNYNSDMVVEPKNEYQELNDQFNLSDSIVSSYRNYKQYILKKKKKHNKINKLKTKKEDFINMKSNFHILIKISTWLSKNSASQLIWIAQKLFKMYLPELLCVVLVLQANMFKNKNILTNIKRIDRILKLCSENPQLVYFATESLKSYKNKKNLKKYKNYFEINKKYKEKFLNKKKDIINSRDILYKVCGYFFN